MNKIIIASLIFVLIIASFFIGYSLNKSDSTSLEIQKEDIIFINEPPILEDIGKNSVITDMSNNFIVYGKLISREPVVFAKENYKELSYVYSLDCRPRQDNDQVILDWAKKDENSYIDNSLNLVGNSEGLFWINTEKCYVYNYQTSVPDHVIIPTSNDMFFRNKDTIFSGRIIALDEDIEVGTNWDYRKKYDIEVDEIYLNLYDFPTQNIKSEIVGWIPPKNGKLYFWGEYQGDYIMSYISAEPRGIWFEPTSGRYEIKITKLEEESTDCSSVECITNYKVSGEVLDTEQGLIIDGKSIQFNYENPTFEQNSINIFIGTITDSIENTRLEVYS